jgi:hypothetical protein
MEDFVYVEAGRQRITQSDGVKTTVCDNRFEIVANPRSDVQEQQAVQALREWIRKRRKSDEL